MSVLIGVKPQVDKVFEGSVKTDYSNVDIKKQVIDGEVKLVEQAGDKILDNPNPIYTYYELTKTQTAETDAGTLSGTSAISLGYGYYTINSVWVSAAVVSGTANSFKVYVEITSDGTIIFRISTFINEAGCILLPVNLEVHNPTIQLGYVRKNTNNFVWEALAGANKVARL